MNVIGQSNQLWLLLELGFDSLAEWKQWVASLTPESVERALNELVADRSRRRIIRDWIAGEIVSELQVMCRTDARLPDAGMARAAILYKLYLQETFSYFAAKLRDRELAREATQELWVRIFEKIAHAQITSPYSFPSFLIEAAKNLYRENVRRLIRLHKEAMLEEIMNDAAADMTQQTVTDNLIEYLYKAIEALPPRQRDVFRRYYFREQSCTEIAEILGIDHDTVKVHLAKSRRALRRVLEDLGFDGSEFH
ncbi:MAG: sigma-70 family RNA polymerase sigma factor [Acidobacteriota bacterium]|nr:sigma-70 family RNA polymerase sigma factor [Blastocatellia bacterium]MDW8240007.1 sigma-70 family RNA polymerase sigma factor [Acidobacteriota bacterium]